MAEMKLKQWKALVAAGAEPDIQLPAEINFSGDERLQKAHCDTPTCPDGHCMCGKGSHHLPQFQKTGTYDHPMLVRWRNKVARDRARRFNNMTMSSTELKKIGGPQTLIDDPGEAQVHQESFEDQIRNQEMLRRDKRKGRDPIPAEPVDPREPDIVRKAALAARKNNERPANIPPKGGEEKEVVTK